MKHHLPRIAFGVPVKQTIEVDDGYGHDNLYLVKVKYVDQYDGRKLRYKTSLHLFTTRELTNAVDRYYHCISQVMDHHRINPILGFAHPITYSSRNGAMITRFFCRINGSKVEGLGGSSYCALFSTREMRRSRDRANMYLINKRFFVTLLLRKVFKWINSLIKRLFS